MVTYIKSDLEFILKQIKIAEDHALYLQSNGTQGAPLFGASTSPNPASIPTYNIAWCPRTVDGSYNHLLPGRAEALAAGIVVVGANSEIVITRTVLGDTTVIAELDNVEEISVNGLNTTANNGNNPTLPDGGIAGGDTIAVIGDFTSTSLNFSTITIDGNAGDDTIDISGLASDHRIVFRTNGGSDTIVGTLRPQDVIELPAGTNISSYTSSTADGVTTLTNGANSISYTADGDGPEIVVQGAGDPTPRPASGVGTPNADTLAGTALADHLIGFAGDDVMIGMGGADILLRGDGNDFIHAGADRNALGRTTPAYRSGARPL